MKKLERSVTDKQLFGICGGIANYFAIDPTLVRVGYVLLTVFTGIFPGLVAYFVLALIMPPKGSKSFVEAEIIDNKK